MVHFNICATFFLAQTAVSVTPEQHLSFCVIIEWHFVFLKLRGSPVSCTLIPRAAICSDNFILRILYPLSSLDSATKIILVRSAHRAWLMARELHHDSRFLPRCFGRGFCLRRITLWLVGRRYILARRRGRLRYRECRHPWPHRCAGR